MCSSMNMGSSPSISFREDLRLALVRRAGHRFLRRRSAVRAPECARPLALHPARFVIPMVDVSDQERPVNRRLFSLQQTDDLPQVFGQFLLPAVQERHEAPLDAAAVFALICQPPERRAEVRASVVAVVAPPVATRIESEERRDRVVVFLLPFWYAAHVRQDVAVHLRGFAGPFAQPAPERGERRAVFRLVELFEVLSEALRLPLALRRSCAHALRRLCAHASPSVVMPVPKRSSNALSVSPKFRLNVRSASAAAFRLRAERSRLRVTLPNASRAVRPSVRAHSRNGAFPSPPASSPLARARSNAASSNLKCGSRRDQ